MGPSASPRRPAAFLDRDGVINEDDHFVFRPEALRFVPGAPEAIRRLNEAGYLVIVVTNQSGIARGLFDEADLARFHDHLGAELTLRGARIDAFYACPYHPDATVERYRADHPDRKPSPGMLLRAMTDLPIDPARSFLIGDQPRDAEAARRAGIPGFLFPGGNLREFVEEVLVLDWVQIPVVQERMA